VALSAQLPIETWAATAVARRWRGAHVKTVTPLKGDASTRRFWRVGIDPANVRDVPASAIAVDLGPDDLPLYARALNLVPEPLAEPPWLTLQRFLSKIGAAVPDLYAAEALSRMMLVEDVGDLALFDAAARGNIADLYRLAASELLVIHLAGTQLLDRGCIAARIAYDARLFRWELEQFAEFGIATAAPGASRFAIAPELDRLAARLDRYPRVFSHRDYHGHNLFVQMRMDRRHEPRLRVIDFQDALMAPASQDLAVLLTTRDAARIITPAIERRVLEFYYAALVRHGSPALGLDDFMESYRLCVLQHALKVVGRFIFLERQGKSGYTTYIPYALAQARRMLVTTSDFRNLSAALGTG
jgi:aminoglycoside/choline kinase family phosphotransferase